MYLIKVVLGVGLLFPYALAIAAPPAPAPAPSHTAGKALNSVRRQIMRLGRDGDVVLQKAWMNNGIEYEKWPVDGKPDFEGTIATPTYNKAFESALKNITIEEWALARKLGNRSTHLADVMGSAIFSDSPEIFDSLTGIRLRPLYPGALPKAYPRENWQEIPGNAYVQSTWDKVDLRMKETKFDLIVARPEGFISRLSKNVLICGDQVAKASFFSLHHRLLSRMWERLTFDDGMMLVQLSDLIAHDPIFDQWISDLNSAGIPAKVFWDGQGLRGPCPILRLEKPGSSPALLPCTAG